jgi:hypothetical protein
MLGFPLPRDAFAHGANLHPDGLGRWLDALASQAVERTDRVVNAYQDADAGDDANDGLSAETPKKTIQEAERIVPIVLDASCVLHLRGVTTLTADAVLSSRVLLRGAKFLIDGGPDVEVMAPIGGGVYTADIASTSSIGSTTAGWVAGAHGGYLVKVLTGPAAGQTRMIRHDHTATTITPTRNFSVSPGAGAQFQVVRPATRITAVTALTWGIIGISGYGTVQLQRVTVDANAYTQLRNSAAAIYLSHVVFESGNSAAVVVNGCRGGSMQAVASLINPLTMVSESTNTFSSAGIGVRGADGIRVLDSVARFAGSYISHLQISNSQHSGFAGTAYKRITAWNCQASDPTNNQFLFNSSGYATTLVKGSASDGLLATACALAISGACDFSDNAGHAISMLNSTLQLQGTRQTGTGNGKSGCYVRQGSALLLTAGQTPTLTGTVGDVASSSPTAQETTWTALAGGSSMAVLSQMSMATVA